MSQWIPLLLLIAVAVGVSHYQNENGAVAAQRDTHRPAQILTVPGFKIETASLDKRHLMPTTTRMRKPVLQPEASNLLMPELPKQTIGGRVEVQQARPVWPIEPIPEDETEVQ